AVDGRKLLVRRASENRDGVFEAEAFDRRSDAGRSGRKRVLEQEPCIRPDGAYARERLELQLRVVERPQAPYAGDERPVRREAESSARWDSAAGRKARESEAPAHDIDPHVPGGERAGLARQMG